MNEQNCAACGGTIVKSWGPTNDFCSRACFRAGRAFCRRCKKPLTVQKNPGGFKKAFCSDLCKREFHRYGEKSPYLQEEIRRSTCKGCGKPITQNKTGSRQFCNKVCNDAYYRTAGREYSLTDKWGSYAPETRKILLELEAFGKIGTAKRLAQAIDREYKIRHNPDTRPHDVLCHCKTCGREFTRKGWATTSRDYCSPRCHPPRTQEIAESRQVILTWEEVDEIRSLYETEQFSQKDIAIKFDVSKSLIAAIVKYRIWKSENDPRRLGRLVPKHTGEYGSKAKLTWEQVDEIRNLATTQHLSSHEIAERYGVANSTIKAIINGYNWKPENDPRVKQEVHV